eukprot:15179116-Heterocapsa_arctica.AAC.1
MLMSTLALTQPQAIRHLALDDVISNTYSSIASYSTVDAASTLPSRALDVLSLTSSKCLPRTRGTRHQCPAARRRLRITLTSIGRHIDLAVVDVAPPGLMR